MKKITLLLALVFMSLNLAAKTVDEIIREFKFVENVEHMEIPESMLQMAGMNDKLKGEIKMIETLSLEECSDGIKERFLKAVKELDCAEYEDLVNSSEKGKVAKVLIKTDGDVVTDLVVISAGGDDCAIVRVTGRFSPEVAGEFGGFDM